MICYILYISYIYICIHAHILQIYIYIYIFLQIILNVFKIHLQNQVQDDISVLLLYNIFSVNITQFAYFFDRHLRFYYFKLSAVLNSVTVNIFAPCTLESILVYICAIFIYVGVCIYLWVTYWCISKYTSWYITLEYMIKSTIAGSQRMQLFTFIHPPAICKYSSDSGYC